MTVLEFRTHRMNEAGALAKARALREGCSYDMACAFARDARHEAQLHEWEAPQEIAARVVPPMRARNGLGEIA